MYSAVIFDLDGTLLNTLADLANAGNHTLEVLGFPTHPVDAYRYLVGNGIPKLIERMLPERSRGPATQQTALSIFLRYYEAHKQDTTAPYPGILPMLQALKGAGLRLGVVSNKENSLSQEVAAHYFPGLFDAVAGPCAGHPHKAGPCTAERPDGSVRRAGPGRYCMWATAMWIFKQRKTLMWKAAACCGASVQRKSFGQKAPAIWYIPRGSLRTCAGAGRTAPAL